MPEEKIKIKDLAGELDVQSKDMLRALRDLGLPAKTTAGSVSVEDAARLRDHFAGRKQGGVERTEVQPNVIVHRRRKDAAPAEPARPAVAPSAAAPREKASEAEVAPAAKAETESSPVAAVSTATAEKAAAEAPVADARADAPEAATDQAAEAAAPEVAETPTAAPKAQKTTY